MAKKTEEKDTSAEVTAEATEAKNKEAKTAKKGKNTDTVSTKTASKKETGKEEPTVVEEVVTTAADVIGDVVETVAETAAEVVETVAGGTADAVKSVVGTEPKGSDQSQNRSRKRAEKVGVVWSDKMTNTVTVRVDRQVKHPMYRKYVKRKKKFMAHDELGATIGDKVRIVETRPLSARKRWRVVEIIQKAEK